MNLVGSKDDGPCCTDGDWTAHNAGITPHFFVDKIKRREADGTETEIENEYVTLVVAGDTLTECCQPVDAQLRERFAVQYSAWKEGKETLNGETAITDWPNITARQAVYLEANNVFTVEALAMLSDYNVGNVMNGRELRDKAARWLKKKGSADLLAENASLRARLDALEKKMKPQRPKMPQAQRDKISLRQKQRHEEAQRGLAALREADSVTDMSEAPTGVGFLPVI